MGRTLDPASARVKPWRSTLEGMTIETVFAPRDRPRGICTMRCIVLIRSHEPLQEGWRKRSFGPAGPLLDNRVKVAGVRFDETYHPVQVWRRIGGGDDPPTASGFNYGAVGPAATYAVRVEADDAGAIERLRRDRQPEIVGVFADPAVSPFPSSYCGDAAIGAAEDVARGLGVPALRRRGLTGGGVHVAVVDTGLDGWRIPVPPFNQITGSLVAAGADVFFAAGNCGADCPDGRCGAGDTGPGASIHGANSHPDVVTVAAVTVTDRRLGYSSQGPGALYSRKPDLAGFSHFKGSGIYPADGGTSAASPVAAGVAAALRQRFATDRLAPAQLKGLLQRTARDLGGDGWDYDLGYGVIDAAAALQALGVEAGLGVKPRARKRAKPAA